MRKEQFRTWNELMGIIDKTGIRLSENLWVAGGALLRAYTGEIGGDIDFWSNDSEKWMPAAAKSLTDRGWKLCNESSYADTYVFPDPLVPKVQLCKFDYTGPADCIDDFDFTVCQLAWDGNTLYCGAMTGLDLNRKALRIVKKTWSIDDRLRRYVARGFSVDVYTVISALAAEWSEQVYE